MFNKSRNRILLLNMIMVSVVTLSAFAVLFLITRQQVLRENRERMYNSSMHVSGFSVIRSYFDDIDSHNWIEIPFMSDLFFAEVGPGGADILLRCDKRVLRPAYFVQYGTVRQKFVLYF